MMELVFDLLTTQPLAAGQCKHYRFTETGGYIGRNNLCEWVLMDTTGHVSGQHGGANNVDLNPQPVLGTAALPIGYSPAPRPATARLSATEPFVLSTFTNDLLIRASCPYLRSTCTIEGWTRTELERLIKEKWTSFGSGSGFPDDRETRVVDPHAPSGSSVFGSGVALSGIKGLF